MTEPSELVLDREKVAQWIKNGAKPTDTVKRLIEKEAKQYERNIRINNKQLSKR